MNKQEQRIAIAEACGFSINRIDRDEDGEIKFIWCNYPEGWQGPDIRPWVPEFSSDLNAMHEAEKVLLGRIDHWWNYHTELKAMKILENHGKGGIIHATAEQRAEAFLKTIGKWEESK
jgi:hypothetical protein